MGILTGIDCKIIFDNNDTFYAGGIVSGRVIYSFNSAETFEEIKLCVRGKALIRYRRGKTISIYKEKFLKDDVVICEEERTEAGTYTFPFTYVIPLLSPSSYTYQDSQRMVTSYVKYYMKTKRPTTFWMHKDAEKEFDVVKFMDLNLVPEARNMVETNVNKHTFWLCCSSRPFFVCFRMPKQGFVPGEHIPFTLECNNQSTYSADNVIVSLRLITTYHRLNADGEIFKLSIKPSVMKLSECSLGPVNAREGKTWNQILDVPKVQPFQSFGCKIIEFNYIVFFEVKFSCFHRSLKGQVPVILGNIPVTDHQLPDYVATMQKPRDDETNITILKNVKDLKKYIIKQDINYV